LESSNPVKHGRRQILSGQKPSASTAIAGPFRWSFRSPKREKVMQMVKRLVENCAANPDFLRGMESLAKLEIK
jgi:hypothetical protein